MMYVERSFVYNCIFSFRQCIFLKITEYSAINNSCLSIRVRGRPFGGLNFVLRSAKLTFLYKITVFY